MSWWDPKSISGLASQAIKNAQKQIDKVLDIDEKEKAKAKASAKSGKSASASSGEDEASKEDSNAWNSWSSWMTPKPSGSEEKMGTETETSAQSPAASSWNFSWGSQQEAGTTGDAAPLSAASKSPPFSTKKSSSADSELSLSGHQKSLEKNVSASGETHSLVTETESQIEDQSKVDKSSEDRLSADLGETEDRQVQKDVEPVPEEATTAASVNIPGEKDSSSVTEGALTLQETVPQKTEEEVSGSRTSPVSVSEKGEEAPFVSESEGSGLSESNTAKEISADSSKDEHQDDEATEQELLEKCDDVNLVPGSEQSERDSPKHTLQYADTASDAHEPSTSQVSCTSYETFETIPEDSGKEEGSVETFDMTSSEPGSDTIRGSSPEMALSRDSSFAHISFSENAQSESVTSVSSEPTLLSLSTEERDPSTVLEEERLPEDTLFSPPSHSSLTLEEEQESECPPRDAFSPQSEQSPLSSPPLDSAATTSSNDSSETSRLDSSADTVVDHCQQLTEALERETGDGSGSQQYLEDSSLAALGASTSPSSSFVKCMIEDAMGMEDPSKHEDSGSDNHSESKSEGSKVDSEFEKSVYSGHESSDEIETTTSSDIEIISTPTPNGEKNIVDFSPIKFSLPKVARSQVPGHHRTDSQSSSSTNSKGEGEQLSPERDSMQDHHHWHPQEEDLDNPQHPQRLLKKLAEMAEVLQARERQLVHLSKDNNDLLETNSILRSQLQQAEEAKETEETDVKALTDEFTRRMGESERKMQTVLKEKEAVKEQLQVAQRDLASRSEDVNLEAVLVEKDEQILGLMEEGEKLSKQQLQNSNIIKKLRTKEKENEKLLASQKKKLDQQKEELDRLKVVLDSKEDMEKKQADAIKQLNTAVQMMEKEKGKLTVEVESSEEKIRGLQSTLDNSYKEIAELHKSNASQDSRAQQAALSAEMQVREELKMAMEHQGQRHRHEREALILQIEDLRLSLARMEKEQNRREEMLKQENSDLQMRLQEDESRSQDLTQSVTSATRPLLRQIENLQATHSMQSLAWEKVEKNLTERLVEAQTLLALAQEKERTATEKLTEATSRCAALEASNSLLRQEKAQLAAQKESDKRRIDLLEERRANDLAQLELAKQKLSDEVAALRRDKVFLETQLETERSRLESEKQRVAVAEDQIRILERERPKSRGTPSPVSVSRQESMNSSFSERSVTPTSLPRPEDGDNLFMMNHGVKVNLYESMRQSGATSLMENLQSQLKLREGEISQLQADIQQLERTRESMARELVNLTNLNEELQEEVQELPKVRTQLKELDARYDALLQMYGEKEERVQELMLDLVDVKEMYKQQINSLMK